MVIFLKKYTRYIELISILFLLLLGAYLRLHNISGYMTFLGDEGRDVLVVKRIIVDHKPTLLGPTASVGGFFLGPIYYYFMVPFLWLWNLDPTGPAVMVALFGIATIYLVYKVGKDFFHPLVGFIAASLYTLSPIVIAYSRSSWNPNLVPFFSTLLIYLLWRVVIKNTWREIFWIGVVLGIGLQLHYLFLFLFPVVGVWFALYGRSRKYLKYYLLGIGGFLVGYAPFLAFEIKHGFPNTITIIRFIQEGKDTGFTWQKFFANINDVTFRLFGRLALRLPQREIWDNTPAWHIGAWIAGTRGFIYLSLTYLGFFVVTHFRYIQKILRIQKFTKSIPESHYRAVLLLLAWLFIPLVLFGFYKRGIYDYYFGIFFAVPFLLFGLLVHQLLIWKWMKWIGCVLWIGLIILNWQGRPFLYPPNNQLAQARRIAQTAFEKTEGKPFNFALVADLNSDHSYRYFFEIWGNTPVTIQNDVIDPERKTVTDQLIVICEIPDCKPLGHPLWEIAGFGPAQIVGQWEVPFVRIFKLIHLPKEESK